MELLWEHLNPYHERAVTKGYGGLLISAGFDGKPSKWRVHLRTIIDYGSCHGHPEAIKTLYRLDGPVAVPFLSNSHRLFLEWRALHAGLRLGFLEKVGPIAAMLPVTRASTAHERPTARHANTRTAEEVFGEDEAWLIEVSDHLRAKRFKPAMRKIDRLGWMCLGYRKPG